MKRQETGKDGEKWESMSEKEISGGPQKTMREGSEKGGGKSQRQRVSRTERDRWIQRQLDRSDK